MTFPITPKQLEGLLNLVDGGKISGKQGKEVFATMVATGERPLALVVRLGLRQISDEATLLPMAEKILADNARQVALYRGGKDGLLGFFVGALLKASGGQANPTVASALMKRLLGA